MAFRNRNFPIFARVTGSYNRATTGTQVWDILTAVEIMGGMVVDTVGNTIRVPVRGIYTVTYVATLDAANVNQSLTVAATPSGTNLATITQTVASGAGVSGSGKLEAGELVFLNYANNAAGAAGTVPGQMMLMCAERF